MFCRHINLNMVVQGIQWPAKNSHIKMGIIFILIWNEKDPEADRFILIYEPTSYCSLCSMSLPVQGWMVFFIFRCLSEIPARENVRYSIAPRSNPDLAPALSRTTPGSCSSIQNQGFIHHVAPYKGRSGKKGKVPLRLSINRQVQA